LLVCLLPGQELLALPLVSLLSARCRRHCLQKHNPPTHARRTRAATFLRSSAMQFPAPDRYVVRLSGALAALLGRAEGAELPEDELLGRLREWGLITYPSPLLAPLLEEWSDVLAAEVLPRLPLTDVALFARVGRSSRAAVVASGLPRAGANGGAPLKVEDFVGSVERLAWAKAHTHVEASLLAGVSRF